MNRKLPGFIFGCLFFLSSVAQAVTVQLGSQGITIPYEAPPNPSLYTGTGGAANLNSSTAQIAAIGYIEQKDAAFQNGGTKTIKNIAYATGNKSCAGCTSTIRVTVEGVATGSGPPAQPDGTIAASGSAISDQLISASTSAGWNVAPDFTSGPVVHYGDLIALRWKFQTYDSGSIAIAGGTTLYDCGMGVQLNVSANSGSTWTNSCQSPPNVLITFADGTVGTFISAFPYNAFAGPTTDTYNSSSNPNSTGITFKLPFGGEIDHLCGAASIANASTSTWTLEFTDNASTPNVLSSIALDPHTVQATGAGFSQARNCFPVNKFSFSANTDYRIEALATGAGNITTTSILVTAASSFDTSFGCGQECAYVTRHNGAYSSATTNKRATGFGVVVSAIDIGSGPVATGGMMVLGVGH